MAKIFLVLGTQGAGKTTVLKGVNGIRTVNIGTEMLAAYSKRFGVKDRDEVRKKELVTADVMARIRRGVIKKITKRKGTVVIDTHATLKSGSGYIPGFSFDDLKTLKSSIKAIIYIDADNSDIMKRRNKDRGVRRREEDTEDLLNQHRNINLALTTAFSLYMEIPIYIVKNVDGKLKNAQDEVSNIIKSYGR